MGRKEGAAVPLSRQLGPRLVQCGLGEVYIRTKRRLHPSNHLATIDVGRILGLRPFEGGRLDPYLTQSRLG